MMSVPQWEISMIILVVLFFVASSLSFAATADSSSSQIVRISIKPIAEVAVRGEKVLWTTNRESMALSVSIQGSTENLEGKCEVQKGKGNSLGFVRIPVYPKAEVLVTGIGREVGECQLEFNSNTSVVVTATLVEQ